MPANKRRLQIVDVAVEEDDLDALNQVLCRLAGSIERVISAVESGRDVYAAAADRLERSNAIMYPANKDRLQLD